MNAALPPLHFDRLAEALDAVPRLKLTGLEKPDSSPFFGI